MTDTLQAKVTALQPDYQMDRLTLGEVRSWLAVLEDLPDDTPVRYRSDAQGLRRTVLGGVLEVVQFQAPDGTMVSP